MSASLRVGPRGGPMLGACGPPLPRAPGVRSGGPRARCGGVSVALRLSVWVPPSLAACRAEAEELRQRNGEVEKNLLRATSELDELRPRLAQHELELKALRARLPNLPPRDWGTNTELEWPGAAAERHREMAAKLEKELFAAQKELKELKGSHAEEKKKRRDAEKDLLALKLSTVDAG